MSINLFDQRNSGNSTRLQSGARSSCLDDRDAPKACGPMPGSSLGPAGWVSPWWLAVVRRSPAPQGQQLRAGPGCPFAVCRCRHWWLPSGRRGRRRSRSVCHGSLRRTGFGCSAAGRTSSVHICIVDIVALENTGCSTTCRSSGSEPLLRPWPKPSAWTGTVSRSTSWLTWRYHPGLPDESTSGGWLEPREIELDQLATDALILKESLGALGLPPWQRRPAT